MKEIEWETLLIRVSNGDEEAFSELYKCTKNDAYRLIYFLASNKNEVEDIMSEVYLALYRSIASYKREQPFQAWFNGLIVRQVRNNKRKSWRVSRLFQKVQHFLSEQQVQVDEGINQFESKEYLLQQVNHLALKFREVIVLRYYQQCSFDEIAQILNVPIGTIKSRHHYALKQLRQQYERVDSGKETKQYVYGK